VKSWRVTTDMCRAEVNEEFDLKVSTTKMVDDEAKEIAVKIERE